MISRFSCVPIFDNDVLVVSDETNDQIQSTLYKLTDITDAIITENCHITHLQDFKSLTPYLSFETSILRNVYFMFFNSLDYIHDIIAEALDYYYELNQPVQLENAFFYFGLNQNHYPEQLDPFVMGYTNHSVYDFSTAALVVSDVLNKLGYAVAKVKVVYIEDSELLGERSIVMKKLVINHPKVQKFELSKSSLLLVLGNMNI